MNGSKVNNLSLEQVCAAVAALPTNADFVWDGKDEDDRPMQKVEVFQPFVPAKSSTKGARLAAKPRQAGPTGFTPVARFEQATCSAAL